MSSIVIVLPQKINETNDNEKNYKPNYYIKCNKLKNKLPIQLFIRLKIINM